MAYIKVSREHWTTGKRKLNYYAWWREFDISDTLWEKLNQFAEEDEFSDTAKWDWQEDEICLSRSGALDDVFKTYCKAPKDWELYHDVIEKESGRIKMKPMRFKYEYIVKVLKVDLKNHRAYVKQLPTRQQCEEAVDFTTKEYWVNLSDQCIYEGVKANDEVKIRKLLNDQFLAISVWESYKPIGKRELDQMIKDWDEMMEDYDEDDDLFGNYTDAVVEEAKKEQEERLKQQRKSISDLYDY